MLRTLFLISLPLIIVGWSLYVPVYEGYNSLSPFALTLPVIKLFRCIVRHPTVTSLVLSYRQLIVTCLMNYIVIVFVNCSLVQSYFLVLGQDTKLRDR
jgi:hypothetical protein